MTGALAAIGLMQTTIPMVVATGGITKVIEATYGKTKNGKPVGIKHWHFKGKQAYSHQHEMGHLKHEHKSYKGYGRTKKSLKKY